jgi:CIC family chloride channel protein
VVELPATTSEGTALTDALGVLTTAPGTGVPVLDQDGQVLVGWLTHQAVLARL